MKTRTVITKELRKNTSLMKLLNERLGDPTHSLYIEAEAGPEQDVLLFWIYKVAAKLPVKLHLRTTPAGVWVRFPYPKYNAATHIADEVRFAIIGIEGEKQLYLMVNNINAGAAELEAVEISRSAEERCRP